MNHANAAALPAWRAKLALYLDLIRWNRPAGWLLLLWPTLSALWIAAGRFPGWHLVAVFTLGTILMRSAGCCINDVADRDFDRHVKRTAQRPITSGAVSVREALGVGAALALVAFALVLTTNVAETSLTIEGIHMVIDSGLERRASFDLKSGVTRLETRQIARASATQRAGRAGRRWRGWIGSLWGWPSCWHSSEAKPSNSR